MNTENQFPQKNEYSALLDFETVLNQSFLNYKKIAFYAGLALFVFMFLFIIFLSAAAIGFLGEENINEKAIQNFQKLLLTKPYNWYYTGVHVLIVSFISPFMAGFYKMADAAEKDTSFGIADLFSYYGFRYFVPVFTSTFIITFSTNGISLLFDEIGLSFVGIIFSLVFNFLTLLCIPLIIFGNCKTIDAIKTSIAIVLKQPMVIFMLIIVAFIGTLLGLFAFCIGIFFTYPFFISVIYMIYNQLKIVPNELTE